MKSVEDIYQKGMIGYFMVFSYVKELIVVVDRSGHVLAYLNIG